MKTIQITFTESVNPYHEDHIDIPKGDSEYAVQRELDNKYIAVLSHINGETHIKISKSFKSFLRFDILTKDNTSRQVIFNFHSSHQPDDNNDIFYVNYDENEKLKIFFQEESFNIEIYHILDGNSLEQDPEHSDTHYFDDISYYFYNGV